MREQILKLQRKMKECGIDVYAVTDSDPHLSEYTGAHYYALEEFSGFTGGEGRLVVSAGTGCADGNGNTAGAAALWTDGRYFTQAENELAGSGIELMRIGEPQTPSVAEWVAAQLPAAGGKLGFDGKCMAFEEGSRLIENLGNRLESALTDRDLCGELWENRPAESITPCWILREEYCGEASGHKLERIREEMKKAHAEVHVVSTLDDIAWILNLRADDIPCTPVFSAYLVIAETEAWLFTDSGHFADSPFSRADEVQEYLRGLGVHCDSDEAFYRCLPVICAGKQVLLDPKKCNYETVHLVQQAGCIVDRMNPSTVMRCIKNETEIRNLRIAQHKDSVALTRFMYWFKNEGLNYALPAARTGENAEDRHSSANAADSGEGFVLTEWSAAEKLHEYRRMQDHFLEESFSTISAYGPNAAMAHYAPSSDPDRDVPIRRKGMYLVDSGGQYYEGTTDVTRTWSCGPLTHEERTGFTLTAIANLRLADAVFLEGTSGLVLDYIAREPFWIRKMNYNHGTGHGVSYLLGVHEPPVGIRYKTATIEGAYPMKEGMYLSDEPGMYVAGQYGVRIENLVLVQHDHTNEYGRFLRFETMNFCPIDKTCLDLSLMEERDIELLNAYHNRVYRELADELPKEEAEWLGMMCAPIVRE